MTTIGNGPPKAQAGTSSSQFFAESLRTWLLAGSPRPVSVLQAGCLAPLRELGIGELEETGYDISLCVVDSDEPLTRQILDQTKDLYDRVIVGDLRTVPLPPRGFDIVYCGQLLERVSHVELVLDRLTSALRPGGLLLIRLGDRDSAWGLLNRRLPGVARRAMWHSLSPGVPGPFPAVYERAATKRGIASYALMRGLVIAHRSADFTLPGNSRRLSSAMRATCSIICRLSRGRFCDSHDELLYVIRKPQDRFARVV